jgi:hypothetical protein
MKQSWILLTVVIITSFCTVLRGNDDVAIDQRGFARDANPDIGAYEFQKINAITIQADKANIAVGEMVNFTIITHPEDADPTAIAFDQLPNDLLSFTGNDFNYKGTGMNEGNVSVSAFSIDNPGLKSNAIGLTVNKASGLNNQEIAVDFVYPNPVSSMLFFSEIPEDDVVLATILGQRFIFRLTSHTLDVSDLPEGIYLLMMRKGNQVLKNKLIIKH